MQQDLQGGTTRFFEGLPHGRQVQCRGNVGVVEPDNGDLVGNENAGAAPDQDVSGLLGYLGVSAPVGPATLGIEGAYASGDDKGTKKNEGVLKFDYQSPFWSVILFNNFDLPGWESNYGSDTSVNNAIAGKVSCAAKVMPALTLYGAAVYAQRLEETAVGAGNDEALERFGVTDNYAEKVPVSAINATMTPTITGPRIGTSSPSMVRVSLPMSYMMLSAPCSPVRIRATSSTKIGRPQQPPGENV